MPVPIYPTDLGTHDGQLFAVSQWTDFSEHPVELPALVAWDGNAWSTLLTGTNTGMSAIGVHEGVLYIGGSAVYRQAGSTWEGIGACGSHPDYQVWAFQDYGGKLVAGGWFDGLGGIPRDHSIAVWDGTQWKPLGAGLSEGVNALAVYQGNLIAGGWISNSGDLVVHGLAWWDGSTWHAFGAGLFKRPEPGHALALAVYRGDLYVGGAFDAVDGVLAKNIARWNGSSWCPLGNGTDGPVTALQVHGDELVVAGDFLTAGGVAARHVASWRMEE